MVQRQRERHYEAFVGVRVPEFVKDRLDALADRERAALGIIVRRVLEAGLPVIERGEGGARKAMMAEARTCLLVEGITPQGAAPSGRLLLRPSGRFLRRR